MLLQGPLTAGPIISLPACLGPHAKQHVVVVIAALDLRDALADGMRPQEVKGRARHRQHLHVRDSLKGLPGK